MPKARAPLTITTADVRELLAVLGEVSELRDDPKVWRRHLLSRLMGILNASAAMAVGARRFEGAADFVMESYTDMGFSAAQRRIFIRWFYENPWEDPLAKAVLKKFPDSTERPAGGTATWARHELVPDGIWYEHPYFQQVRQPMGVDHSLISVFFGPADGHFAFLACYRPCKVDQRFGPREVAMLDLCHSALAWLYRAEDRHRPVDGALSPRLNQTLAYLMAGKSEKEIADLTELSIHTIHDYVKALYRHFQVSSRSELLARFISQ